ncbi:restriction endonuclease [Pseudonocardia benzenivorans]
MPAGGPGTRLVCRGRSSGVTRRPSLAKLDEVWRGARSVTPRAEPAAERTRCESTGAVRHRGSPSTRPESPAAGHPPDLCDRGDADFGQPGHRCRAGCCAPACGGAVKAVVWGQRQQEAAQRHHLARAQSLGELLALTPTEFEHATGAILSRSGFRLTRVGGPGDLGADLRGYDPHGRTVIVQCKRYAPGRKVSSRDLQSFLGVLVRHHQAQCGVYVTTADYTKNARDLARQHGIWLLDGNALVAMGHGVSGRPWV